MYCDSIVLLTLWLFWGFLGPCGSAKIVSSPTAGRTDHLPCQPLHSQLTGQTEALWEVLVYRNPNVWLAVWLFIVLCLLRYVQTVTVYFQKTHFGEKVGVPLTASGHFPQPLQQFIVCHCLPLHWRYWRFWRYAVKNLFVILTATDEKVSAEIKVWILTSWTEFKR